MPKVNTYLAGLMAASMLTFPANAGQSSLMGAPVYTQGHQQGHSAAGGMHPGYGSAHNGQYAGSVCSTNPAPHNPQTCGDVRHGHYGANLRGTSSSATATASAYATAGASGYSSMNVAGASANGMGDIVCVVQGAEIPCASIPGLADSLRAQGQHNIADRLPQSTATATSSAQTGYSSASASAYAGPGYATSSATAYSNAGYATAGAPAYAQTGYAVMPYAGRAVAPAAPVAMPVEPMYPIGGPIAAPIYQPAVAVGQVASGYGPYGTPFYGAPGTSWITAAPILSPCGQVVGYQCGPSRVTLGNGASYALNGGVGTGIYGEFYGGGGTLIQGGSRFSGVMNSAGRLSFASRQSNNVNINNNVTVNRPVPQTRTPRPHHRTPRPHTRSGGHH